MINDITTGLRIPSLIPLDVKLYTTSKANLLDLGVNNNLAYTYYLGMRVYCATEREIWEWRQELIPTENRLLPTNFTYPNGLIVNDIDYSNQSYNFFKVLQASDIVIPPPPAVPVKGLTNEGIGVDIYNGLTPTGIGKFGRVNSNTVRIIKQLDGSINLEVPQNNFDYLTAFYVNGNYTPTVDSPSDGSIIRPYVSYDEAKTAVIGTGTVYDPQFKYATIILQTGAATANNPTINFTYIKGENVQLTYTGNDPYMFDTEVLYPSIPKNSPRNDLTIEIFMALTGTLVITRTNGIGLVRGLGSNRNGLGEIEDKTSQISIGINETDVITLNERTQYAPSVWEGDITNASNVTLESFYGTPHKYTTQLSPTQPLLYSRYEAKVPFKWGVVTKGIININTLANTAIKIDGEIGGDAMLLSGKNINISVIGNYISTADGTKVPGFPNHYLPYPNRNLIELNNASVYCEELGYRDGGGYRTTGVDTFFKITNNGGFRFGKMEIFTNIYVNKFIDCSDVSNTMTGFGISNDLKGSNISITGGRTFISTNQASFALTMPNTTIKPFLNVSVNPLILTPDTIGTLSSFFGTPCLSGIGNFADDATAELAGLIKNSLYFNTTNNALDRI